MDLETVREFCLSLPNVTERVQWGNDLLFRIGDKMFAVACMDASYPNKLSFKCSPETFEELTELEGIIPAPYLARAKWVALLSWDAVPPDRLRALLREAYDMVLAKLPKKVRADLAG
jgi:predicted DNA-binding protein (MmcQ/YjbR family)